MIFADKLIQLRKKNAWSQEELAEKMNVSRQSVSKWEGAQSVPDLDKVLQLARIFGVSTDYLLKDELGEEEYVADAHEPDRQGVRRITMEEANEFLAAKSKTAKPIALGVFMCVLSPICLLLLGAASEQPQFNISENLAGGIGLIVLFILVAAAVAIFISCGAKTGHFEFLDTEEIETEYGVSGMVRERMARYKETYTRDCIIGTCVCILSPIPLITSAFITENDFFIVIALSITIILAGIGAFLFTVSGINHASMQKLLEEGEYSREAKHKSKRTGAIGTVYWLVIVAAYLGYSFYTESWNNSWIIWPVAGVIFAALMTLCGAFMKKEK
ncbi:MAG: helix-turn-helix transcriptional regulator [Clostridiales bacterium]|nr:helix-turn-helix transcriptional regulator [Clostridiales bacterium]